ncbi:ABC transporter permease [Nocardiopsis dassonvillei]|uniref:Transport permease protein n=1 Tax=Nocardiopsis dassonvillei (strain ATCC 23218 / DSM 43111 / CIP 107115 / JCM 7437 / KCTC 9190 / NBRC 14626 / NCTC 10488 / NRRL B-5397 / IMRU 509) TaxID=446468 RepID=D7AZ80_NOCDD|nr:ABC transporter permease [Nocardiopsis dassonvillei]ADH70060.1 ABC-2 type transporter [Nocardiopsis dassonvillei subsp. dassonvillei DSM 43111]NKY78436.1 ABC transporter permease [Nocardiopsis dassonvillei]VEI90575.1 Daunorubicin/doxorubicin resistance ABC transporter permease protein drrB [Nocardiopsis dassonvillei]
MNDTVIQGAVSAPADRLRWALADGWTIARRDVVHWLRQPGQLVAGLLFPVVMVLMFGFLFGGAMTVPGGGDYREFLMPGMFAMAMVFGVGETVTAVSQDAARGVTDRFRSMPMAPSAVVVGRCAADMLRSAITLVLLVLCGLLVGWQWNGGTGEAAAGIGLLLLLRFSLVWVGVYVGLAVRGEGAVTAVHMLEFPLGFLSNAFVATASMPVWLGAVADWNPLSSTVAATRELFGNPGWGGESWIAQNAVLMAVVWPLVLTAVFFPLCVRRFRALGR